MAGSCALLLFLTVLASRAVFVSASTTSARPSIPMITTTNGSIIMDTVTDNPPGTRFNTTKMWNETSATAVTPSSPSDGGPTVRNTTSTPVEPTEDVQNGTESIKSRSEDFASPAGESMSTSALPEPALPKEDFRNATTARQEVTLPRSTSTSPPTATSQPMSLSFVSYSVQDATTRPFILQQGSGPAADEMAHRSPQFITGPQRFSLKFHIECEDFLDTENRSFTVSARQHDNQLQLEMFLVIPQDTAVHLAAEYVSNSDLPFCLSSERDFVGNTLIIRTLVTYNTTRLKYSAGDNVGYYRCLSGPRYKLAAVIRVTVSDGNSSKPANATCSPVSELPPLRNCPPLSDGTRLLWMFYGFIAGSGFMLLFVCVIVKIFSFKERSSF